MSKWLLHVTLFRQYFKPFTFHHKIVQILYKYSQFWNGTPPTSASANRAPKSPGDWQLNQGNECGGNSLGVAYTARCRLSGTNLDSVKFCKFQSAGSPQFRYENRWLACIHRKIGSRPKMQLVFMYYVIRLCVLYRVFIFKTIYFIGKSVLNKKR